MDNHDNKDNQNDNNEKNKYKLWNDKEGIDSPINNCDSIHKLKLIHMTKCGGTTITLLGEKYGINWGINDIEYGFHHELFTLKPYQLRQKYNWFTIVRNPYDRIISEAIWINKMLSYHIDPIDYKSYNELIKCWISNIENNKPNDYYYGKINGDHFTPQYKYLEGIDWILISNSTRDDQGKVMVLRNESLQNDFNLLMKYYYYEIRMETNEVANKRDQKETLSISDLSIENIELINRIYKRDFELFGYMMINYRINRTNL